MAASDNPYASPLGDVSTEKELTSAPTEVEELRRRYLKHETAIRSVGKIYCGAGVLVGLIVLLGPPVDFLILRRRPDWMDLAMFLLYSVVAVIACVLGMGLQRLNRRVRIPVIVVSFLGLIQIPITLLHIYVLYLMFSSKAKTAFSPQYRAAIEQTPYLRYKTSWTTWIVLILFILLVVVGVGLMLHYG